MIAMIDYPAWLKPEILPGLPFRWYGLMYVFAFGTAWFLFRHESKRRRVPWGEDQAASFFLWLIVGVLVGGRLAGTLIYEPTDYYWRHPWYIFWPFDAAGRFVGFQGMSFHGGFVGVVVASIVWCKFKKQDWFEWADLVAVSAPLGYTFGRLGNFINGELWGKITTAPWGIVFPYAEKFSARESWVQEFASTVGIPLNSMNDMVNLPRHPSQLYEALLEGIVLWLILWLFARRKDIYRGFSVGLYIIGYGTARFFIEYFREPDSGLGYIINLTGGDVPTYRLTSFLTLSMGQILSLLMILGGVVFLSVARRHDMTKKAAEARLAKPSSRKLRKRIK